MANRCGLVNQIELLSGSISAQTYFDANWQLPVTALNDASLGYCNGIAVDSGSANNYILTSVYGAATAYNPGMFYSFLPANTNTGASTLTIDGLTSQSIFDAAGNPLTAGIIQAGIRTDLIYIAGAFRLIYLSVPGTLVSNLVNSASGTTTLTVNCGGYTHVNITIDTTGGPGSSTTVLLLTNVKYGTYFNMLWLVAGLNQLLKFSASCTDQAGFTIPNITGFSGSGTQSNLITGGIGSVSLAAIVTGSYYYVPSSPSLGGLRFSQVDYH